MTGVKLLLFMIHIQSHPAKRTYFIVLIFTILFATPGVIIFVKSSDPNLLYIVAGVMGFLFLNLRMTTFECTDTLISFRSLLKHQKILLQDVLGVTIDVPNPKTRAPKFIVRTRSQGDVVLEIRSLPLQDVKSFTAFLKSRNISFTVGSSFMCKRMASQILSQEP
jgi:hypothetical protein